MRIVSLLALASLLAACAATETMTEADLSDSGIKARIEAALQAQKDVDLRLVTVEVHARAATVSGLVATYEEKTRIEAAARRVRGYEQILFNVSVKE